MHHRGRRGRVHAIVGILALLLAACAAEPASTIDVSGSASSPSSASATASPSAAPTRSATQASTAPSGGPSATTMTATFAEDTGTTAAVDVVAWDEGFLAIGHAWPGSHLAEMPVPRLWASSDGMSWKARPIDLGVERASLAGIVVREDGRLLIVGSSAAVANPSQSEISPAGWISTDATTWEPADLPMGTAASSIDHGARGYVLTAGTELWFSADGETWTKTGDGARVVRAGDEGFVAPQVDGDGFTGSTIASADGKSWFTSAPFAQADLGVAAVGGDWLASGFMPGDEGAMGVWRSANGLDWTRVLDVNDLTPADGPKTGRGLEYDSISGAPLASTGTRAFLTLTNNHCCAQLPWGFGAWTTADGEAWSAVIEQDAVIEAAASKDGTVVMVGYLRRGEEAAFWRLGSGE